MLVIRMVTLFDLNEVSLQHKITGAYIVLLARKLDSNIYIPRSRKSEKFRDRYRCRERKIVSLFGKDL